MSQLIEVNVRGNKDNYSQRNDEIRPEASCNVTSMIMGLSYIDMPFPVDTIYRQPEDALLNFLLTDKRVDGEYKKLFPIEYKQYIDSGKDYKKTYPPNELHAVLSYGTNLWLGKNREEITRFRTDLSLTSVLYEFIKGKPVVLSGKFGKLGHIVCGIGFTTTQSLAESTIHIDTKQVVDILIDDPFGDYHTLYSSSMGRGIKMSVSDFMHIMKESDKDTKWGHLF